MAAVDAVARVPLYPGPDIVAYRDAIEVALTARAPLYPGNDVVAYPELRARNDAAAVPVPPTPPTPARPSVYYPGVGTNTVANGGRLRVRGMIGRRR